MDRDFVLNIKAPQAQRSFPLTGKDGNGIAGLASFQPFFPGLWQTSSLALVLVIDCWARCKGIRSYRLSQAAEKS